MKKIYAIATILLTAFTIQAQQFEWLATPEINFTLNPEGIGYPSASDSQGNTFVCGFKDNAMPYTDVFGNVWLLKYDSNGQLLFSKTITGTVCPYTMKTDASGNLYVVAGYINEITTDNLHITTNLQGVKPILLKFSPNGDLLWNKPITMQWVEYCKALAIDSNQNVYIGYSYDNSYIDQYDPDGNPMMTITQTNIRSISSIDVDTEGNIYAAGACADMNVSFNGTPVVNSLPYNTYLVKYNPAGQHQWNHFVEDVTCPEPKVVVRTPDEVYFSSYLFGAFAFGDITTEGPVNGSFNDFFLARLNASGTFQWVREVPGNGEVQIGNRNYLALDNQGNPYFAGRFRGTIQWNPTITSQSINFNNDILVLKYNPQGEVQWAKRAGGDSEDRTDGLTVLPDGNLVLTGMVYGNVAFDALTHNALSYPAYPYVAKLSTATLENHTANNPLALVIYPNPATALITLHSSDYIGKAHLYNVLGQELKSITITAEETTIDISGLESGTYFIRLENRQLGQFIKL